MDEGYTGGTIYAMAQSRDGYLWVSTMDGLARFDGVQFDKFSEGNTPGLNGVVIAYFFEDGDGIFEYLPRQRVTPGRSGNSENVGQMREVVAARLRFDGPGQVPRERHQRVAGDVRRI